MFIVQFDNHDRDESFWDPATERQSSRSPAHGIEKEEKEKGKKKVGDYERQKTDRHSSRNKPGE